MEVPVIITNTVSRKDNTSNFYNVYANKMSDWTKWNAPVVDSILQDVDGGFKTIEIPGDNGTKVTVKDEHGKYRDMARNLGLFVDVIPKNITASGTTLLELARLREKTLGGKYQYDDAQLLFIESLREAILDARKKLIREGETDGGIIEKYHNHLNTEKEAVEKGQLVARVAFLHAAGMVESDIAKRVGIPLEIKTDTKKVPKGRIVKSSNKKVISVDVPNVKGYLKIAEARKSLDAANVYKVLVSEKFNHLDALKNDDVFNELCEGNDRNGAIDYIKKKFSIEQGVAEDYYDFKDAFPYQASEVFSYLIETEKNRIGHKASTQLRVIDLPVTKQSGGKGCNLAEFLDIAALDKTFSEDPEENLDLAEKFWNGSTNKVLNTKLAEILDANKVGPIQPTLL
jgi:hypothetical protein